MSQKEFDDFVNVPAEELHDLVQSQVNWAIDCLKGGTDTDWCPKLAVFASAGPGYPDQLEVFAIMLPFNEHDEKRQTMAAIGRQICDKRLFPRIAVLSAEAWHSVQKPDAKRIQPRDDPARQEIIIVTGSTLKFDRHALVTIPVSRTSANGIVTGTPSAMLTENCESNILAWFFQGFREAAQAHVARRSN